MPRRLRNATGGYVYHVLNRAVGRATLFDTPGDYLAFLKVLRQAQERRPVPLLAYAVMPNHWHLVLWPRGDGDLSEHLRWLTVTHTQRWHAHRRTAGTGPVYQGRFKSFPVQEDEHCLWVCRYVERNPLRTGLVKRAEDWPWTSLYGGREGRPALADPPAARPRDWAAWVNRAETAAEVDALRRSVLRGAPFGEEGWQRRTAEHLRLQSSLRARGRPAKAESERVEKP